MCDDVNLENPNIFVQTGCLTISFCASLSVEFLKYVPPPIVDFEPLNTGGDKLEV